MIADLDKSGSVSIAELKKIMYPDGGADDAQVVFVFSQMDKNGDGKVKVSEFVSFVVFLKSGKRPKEADEKLVMKLFEAKDNDGDHQLSVEEMCLGMGCETDEEKQMVQSLFKRLDADSSGTVSLSEFAALYGAELAPSPPAKEEKAVESTVEEVIEIFDPQMAESIKEIFRNADTNGDGVISKDELKNLFREIAEWSDEEFEVLFAEADKNGDGKIQHQEFIDWVMGSAAKGKVNTDDLVDAGEAVKEKSGFDLAI